MFDFAQVGSFYQEGYPVPCLVSLFSLLKYFQDLMFLLRGQSYLRNARQTLTSGVGGGAFGGREICVESQPYWGQRERAMCELCLPDCGAAAALVWYCIVLYWGEFIEFYCYFFCIILYSIVWNEEEEKINKEKKKENLYLLYCVRLNCIVWFCIVLI